jgi:uncharacterized protein YjbJ (UPF0337 family)
MSNRIDEIVGKVKQSVGSLTGNEDMEQEGEAEATTAKAEREVEGAADQTLGSFKESVGDISDDQKTELEGQARKVEGDIKRAG